MEQCGATKEQWDGDGGTVWWYSGTLLIKQRSGTVEKRWWNSVSGTVMVEQCGETME